MRSFAFNVAYWALSIVYCLAAAFAALAPGRMERLKHMGSKLSGPGAQGG